MARCLIGAGSEVESLYQGDVTITEDREQERLEQQVLELERQEESLIRDAAAAGKNIPRRSRPRDHAGRLIRQEGPAGGVPNNTCSSGRRSTDPHASSQ